MPRHQVGQIRKREVAAIADAKIMQCVVYSSEGEKRVIIVYVCGQDVYWANKLHELFDIDRVKTAPDWLAEQVLRPRPGTTLIDHTGQIVRKVEAGKEVAPVVSTANPEVPRLVDALELDNLGEEAIPQG